MTCAGFGVWALIDLFLIPGIVEEENAAHARLIRGPSVNQTVVVSVDNSSSGGGKRRRAATENPFDFS